MTYPVKWSLLFSGAEAKAACQLLLFPTRTFYNQIFCTTAAPSNKKVSSHQKSGHNFYDDRLLLPKTSLIIIDSTRSPHMSVMTMLFLWLTQWSSSTQSTRRANSQYPSSGQLSVNVSFVGQETCRMLTWRVLPHQKSGHNFYDDRLVHPKMSHIIIDSTQRLHMSVMTLLHLGLTQWSSNKSMWRTQTLYVLPLGNFLSRFHLRVRKPAGYQPEECCRIKIQKSDRNLYNNRLVLPKRLISK